ncbi:hypothetical protein ACWCQJ_20890 [Streptomyces olivaceus]
MSAVLAAVPQQASADAWDLPLWGEWLNGRLDPHWRAGEWDAETNVFTGSVDNPFTAAHVCRVVRCTAKVESFNSYCSACDHHRLKRKEQDRGDFAETHQPGLRHVSKEIGQTRFTLAPLSSTVRTEILYALQQRDQLDVILVPARVRYLTAKLPTGLRSLFDLGPEFSASLDKLRSATLRGLMDQLVRARTEHEGSDPTSGDIWDCHLVGLLAGKGREYRATTGTIDFTGLRQTWLREVAKEYGRQVRPTVLELRFTVQAASIASTGLASRPWGDTPGKLQLADMSTVVDAFRTAINPRTGRPYGDSHCKALLGHWRRFLDRARLLGLMDQVPGTFALSPAFHQIGRTREDSEDELGRAIPEHVIAQLDEYLHLIGTSYERGGWTSGDYAQMYAAYYRIVRDTGRRPEEAARLRRGCVQRVDGKPTLIYDNLKRRRYGRRLPITEATARHIEAWEKTLSGLPVRDLAKEWLFPAPGQNRTRRGHMSAHHFSAKIFRTWVNRIPALLGEELDDQGSPVPLDRSEIIVYGLRHA